MTAQYDFVIIGAGTAGNSAAFAAAEKGRRVALIERDKLGGTCHNYGCDPTKTLLHVGQLRYRARHANRYGLRTGSIEVDWDAVQAWVQKVLEEMQGGTDEEARQSVRDKGIDLLFGEARFVSAHEVEVNGETLSGDQILIATGMQAVVPDIEGLRETGFITNVEAVSLPKLPGRLAVVGGGPLGAEFAQLFRRFGVEIIVVEQSETLLPTEDSELSDMLADLLRKEGIKIELGAELTNVAQTDTGKRITFKRDHETLTADVDEILVALGRRPNLDALNLETAGVETTKKGVEVDAYLRTNVPHIWAAGDIASQYPFTHVAEAQGKLVVHNAFAQQPRPFNDYAVPWATYTDPELAHVGKTEDELNQDGVPYYVVRHLMKQNDRAIAIGRTEGMVKMLVGDDDLLLGGHVLAAHGGEIIAPLVVAMRNKLPVTALADTLLPYPTLAESVRYACQACE